MLQLRAVRDESLSMAQLGMSPEGLANYRINKATKEPAENFNTVSLNVWKREKEGINNVGMDLDRDGSIKNDRAQPHTAR
jgi:hypothetical protein